MASAVRTIVLPTQNRKGTFPVRLPVMYFHAMPVLPDLRALVTAADAVDRVAATVEADAGGVARLLEELPWHGPRRHAVGGGARLAVGAARGQVAAERDLARALRQLALDVEHELAVLAALAARARRHLEDLMHRARALVAAAADAVAGAAAQVGTRLVLEVVTLDPLGALREARAMAERAGEILRSVVVRLQTLPDPSDPVWRELGPMVLAWRPV